jgi:hypothetical protein
MQSVAPTLTDPPAYGPTTWGLLQWGIVLGLLLFLLVASAAIAHLARPRRSSEVAVPPRRR